MFITHCHSAQDGIIVTIPPVYKGDYFKNICSKDVAITVEGYGLKVTIKDIVVPIPEFMIDYFVDNRTVTIYLGDPERYMWEAEYAVELPKDDIVEARGVYKHMQKVSNGNNATKTIG